MNKYITEKYGDTIYPTLVIVGTEDKMKMSWLIRPDTVFCDLCRTYGTKLKEIAVGNPRKIESILMGDVIYYFYTEHLRENLNNYCIFVFLFSMEKKSSEMLKSIDIVPMLYASSNVPHLTQISQHSRKLTEYVRQHNKVSQLISGFMSDIVSDYCDKNQEKFFYPIDDIGDRLIKEYFSSKDSPCRFKIKRKDDNMYIRAISTMVAFFLLNAMLMISKFSIRTVEVYFKNNLETLEILFKCPFHNSFFGLENDRNNDVVFGEICELTSSHPAFVDYELLKRLGNHLGAKVSLRYGGKNHGLLELSLSKLDINFSNLLRAVPVFKDCDDVHVCTIDSSVFS